MIAAAMQMHIATGSRLLGRSRSRSSLRENWVKMTGATIKFALRWPHETVARKLAAASSESTPIAVRISVVSVVANAVVTIATPIRITAS